MRGGRKEICGPANTEKFKSEGHPNLRLQGRSTSWEIYFFFAMLVCCANRDTPSSTHSTVFSSPPLMGGMVLATSEKTKDRKFPLGAYPSWLNVFYTGDLRPWFFFRPKNHCLKKSLSLVLTHAMMRRSPQKTTENHANHIA